MSTSETTHEAVSHDGTRPRVVLGVSGGIAAYKACELLRRLTESGHDVTVVDDFAHNADKITAALATAPPGHANRFVLLTDGRQNAGNALAGASDDDALALFAQDIVLMRQVGMRPVVDAASRPKTAKAGLT